MLMTLLWKTVAVAVAFGSPATTAPDDDASSGVVGRDAGAVTLVDPLDATTRYDHGDSTSAFSLALPSGAACPGDSANDGWRVHSFIVPSTTDITALRFQALRPASDAPATHRSLRLVDGSIYIQQMTAEDAAHGEPGLILPVPPVTFAHFETGTFPAGQYTIGIACALVDGQVRQYWDTGIAFESAPEVSPGGLRWRVLADGSSIARPGRDLPLPSWLTIGASATLAAALAAFWLTRSNRVRRSAPSAVLPKGEPT